MIFSENRLPLLLIMLILVEHDLFGKPASTFPDHAHVSGSMIFSENRLPLFRIMLERYLETLKAISVDAAGTFSSCGNNAGIRIAA